MDGAKTLRNRKGCRLEDRSYCRRVFAFESSSGYPNTLLGWLRPVDPRAGVCHATYYSRSWTIRQVTLVLECYRIHLKRGL